MTIASTSAAAVRSPWRHVPLLAVLLAAIAVVLLALVPVGWRAGWWPFRFSLLTLMPWVAYFGIGAVILSALALLVGRSRIERGGVAIAIMLAAQEGLWGVVARRFDIHLFPVRRHLTR